MERGLTVNPGVIGGGTLPNVIAAEAWAHIDFSIAGIARKKDRTDVSRIASNRPGLPTRNRWGSQSSSDGTNQRTAKLFAKAATLAAELGFVLQEATTGGGSDGNFTLAIGVPTLDGMGAVGEGAHASNESILIEHLAPQDSLTCGDDREVDEVRC